jgi:hypothetical protein
MNPHPARIEASGHSSRSDCVRSTCVASALDSRQRYHRCAYVADDLAYALWVSSRTPLPRLTYVRVPGAKVCAQPADIQTWENKPFIPFDLSSSNACATNRH